MNRQSFIGTVVLASALTICGGKAAIAQDDEGGDGTLVTLPGLEIPGAEIWIGPISGWKSIDTSSVLVIREGDSEASGSTTPPPDYDDSELALSSPNARFPEQCKVRKDIGSVRGKIAIKVYSRSGYDHAPGDLKVPITAKAVSGPSRSAVAQILFSGQNAYAVANCPMYRVVTVPKVAELPDLVQGTLSGPSTIRIDGSYTLILSGI